MEKEPGHPFYGVDVARLDADLPALLAYASEQGLSLEEQLAGREGLTARERRLFRLGVLVGLGEWNLVSEAVGSLVDEGTLTDSEAERALAEAGMVKGWLACVYLRPALEQRGLNAPASVAEAVAVARATPVVAPAARAAGATGLTERELFALGLGIAWGARCWDT